MMPFVSPGEVDLAPSSEDDRLRPERARRRQRRSDRCGRTIRPASGAAHRAAHDGPLTRHRRSTVMSVTAIVVAGAGARGAYEAGILSELVPHLRSRPVRIGEDDRIVVIGTSAGAINA